MASIPFSLPQVSVDQNMKLIALVTKAELKKFLDLSGSDKSPRPNDFSSFFFKFCWKILAAAVCEVFHSCSMLDGWKMTLVALLPNKQNPLQLKEFRPINLCNVIYKIIAELLVLRMQPNYANFNISRAGSLCPWTPDF